MTNNIKTCGAGEKSIVLAGDYTKTLARIKEKADIFFLDPPYAAGLYEKCLELIETLDLLNEEGIIIAEHGKYDEVPEQVGRLMKVKERRYGKILVSIYQYQSEETEEEEF